MKSRWILALLVALVCMVAPAMAQSAPFVISGDIYDSGDNPCNGTWVRIANLNTSVSWNADNYSTSNYYQLVLDSDNVSVGNVLSIEASGCSQSKTLKHTVTQGENDDGWFSQNITLESAAEPDLVITEKSEILDGSAFTVNYTLANTGGSDAGASTTCIYVDGVEVATDPVAALALGETYEGTVVINPFDCPCGTAVTVTVCADNDGVVDESDEANNCFNNTFDCPPCAKPDLEITDIWTELKRVGKVNTITIYYNITNNGGGEAGRSNSNLTVDGVVQRKKDGVGKLAPWETRTEKFTYRGDPSSIMVCADCKYRVTESNETNNCLLVAV